MHLDRALCVRLDQLAASLISGLKEKGFNLSILLSWYSGTFLKALEKISSARKKGL